MEGNASVEITDYQVESGPCTIHVTFNMELHVLVEQCTCVKDEE